MRTISLSEFAHEELFEQILAEGAIDEEGMYIDCAEYEIDLTDLVGINDG